MNPEDDDPVATELTICEGPPVCTVLDPTSEYMAACPWCEHILVMKDGSEVTTRGCNASKPV